MRKCIADPSDLRPFQRVFTNWILELDVGWGVRAFYCIPSAIADCERLAFFASRPNHVLRTKVTKFAFKSCIYFRCIQCHVNYVGDIGYTEDFQLLMANLIPSSKRTRSTVHTQVHHALLGGQKKSFGRGMDS